MKEQHLWLVTVDGKNQTFQFITPSRDMKYALDKAVLFFENTGETDLKESTTKISDIQYSGTIDA